MTKDCVRHVISDPLKELTKEQVAELEGPPGSAQILGLSIGKSSTDGRENSDRIWKTYYSSGSDISGNKSTVAVFFALGNILLLASLVFLFWKNNSVQVTKYYGAVIPFVFFNQWKVWWGDKQYINFEYWSILWPIFFILGIFFAIYFLTKFKKHYFHGLSSFLSIWIIIFTLHLCFIPISPRYLMMLYFPIYILVSLFAKKGFKKF